MGKLAVFPLFAAVVLLLIASCRQKPDRLFYDIDMNSDWQVFSSVAARAKGDVISLPGFEAYEWYPADIPSTVLSALRQNGYYPDIYFADNLLDVETSRFEEPWWYRKVFYIEETNIDENYLLTFEGLNYKANIWLNGELVAGEDEVEGPFGIWQFNIALLLKEGDNVLAVEVIPPVFGDLTMGFVDWNPEAPDKNMGLWRGVYLRKTGPVSMHRPNVVTKVNTGTLDEAWLHISTVLRNHSEVERVVRVTAEFEDVEVSKTATIEPNQEKEIVFSPDEFRRLHLRNPRLWWPNNLGEPDLYDIKIRAETGKKITDNRGFRFGIREVEDYMTPEGHLGFRVNGQKVLIKGGGWVDDMLLADSDERVIAQVDYAKHLNLNTIRLEGFWGRNKTLYDRCDENGIMLMIGWSCQWEWEQYSGRPQVRYMSIFEYEEMEQQARAYTDQVYWLRHHPSVFLWNFGSDKLLPPELEKMLLEKMAVADTTRPLLSHCGSDVSEITGPSGVKMHGPYDWVPPVYWYINRNYGGAYGFNTETGPGPQVPPIESIKRMLPEENLWPVDDMWAFHCGTFEFDDLSRFLVAFNARYGEAATLEEFAFKNQISNYEAMRPMFEAFAVNKFESTGVIQWMYNSAWPAMYWQLFDYYLMPNGAFYGAKKANEPFMAIYNYGDGSVYVHNEHLEGKDGLKLSLKVFDIESKLLLSEEVSFDIGANRSVKIYELPEVEGLSTTWFLDLRISDASGEEVAVNFYWLPRTGDVPDFESTYWVYTPTKEFADLTALNHMPRTNIEFSYEIDEYGGYSEVSCELRNDSDLLAFFLELSIVDTGDGKSVLPVFWDDNYVSILPGETRTLKGRVESGLVPEEGLTVIVNGWNTD